MFLKKKLSKSQVLEVHVDQVSCILEFLCNVRVMISIDDSYVT